MFSRDFIAKTLEIEPSVGPDVGRIWTDSRSLQKGDLFAAVPGEKFDGHDFVADSISKGAIAALVSKKDFKNRSTLPQNFWLIEVPDTIEALRKLARAHRANLRTKFFAVAGSNGKTTTKEWLAFLLRKLHGEERVFKTERSNNSILGIALTLLQLKEPDFAVIEIGIDEPGWMDKHLDVVRPDAGLITTIEEEHLQQLKNIETVASEELKLLEFLKRTDGAFAANLDSPWIEKSTLPSKSLTYSLDRAAQIEGKYLAPRTLSAFGISFHNPLAGKHNAQNLLSALSAVRLLQPNLSKAELEDLAKQCPQFKGEAHRSLWLEFGREVRVFDDCYNANPSSMEKALETFVEISKGCHQKIILGDMRDLGEASSLAHTRILNLAMVSEFDQIFLWGPEFAKAWAQISKIPLPSDKLKVFSTVDFDELKTNVKSQILPHDCFFLKGSRGMALERLLPIFEEVAGKK